MGKSVYIAEKPSVAKAFGDALANKYSYHYKRGDGFLESDEAIVTWCVGHLVTMSYPEVYDEKYKRWVMDTLPFIPEEFLYEVIPDVKKQFSIVSSILTRKDVDTIYICTDSGREGEYIYRLVDAKAGVKDKVRKRVWIDSQTEEEIIRGINEAKDDSEYDNVGSAAYLRAKADYLMGINFSRVLTLRYGYSIKTYLDLPKCVISVGRVMTCVLGIIVEREREIRSFVKTPFYRINADVDFGSKTENFEWHVSDKSKFLNSPKLYNDKGFKAKEDADALISSLGMVPFEATVVKSEHKKEVKNPPLLYNLAELQNDCSRFFKINPDETLAVGQELYEKKLTTYPRTDARVLSTAISKVISQNIKGLENYQPVSVYAKSVIQHESFKGIAKTRYVNDKAITDHYAIIPTGQGLSALSSLSPTAQKVYEIIARRFLAIFYPPANYSKVSLCISRQVEGTEFAEEFASTFKVLASKGYLHVMDYSFFANKKEKAANGSASASKSGDDDEESDGQAAGDEEIEITDEEFLEEIKKIKKGSKLKVNALGIKEGETSPPKRYHSGTLILTMENAGQFIEDEDLRAQIKGSGIGTSATRAGILTKLVNIGYLSLNKKTQIITPTQMGEMVYETVGFSMKSMLSPSLTASWEKGLTGVSEGEISEDEYMDKLDKFIISKTDYVKKNDARNMLNGRYNYIAGFYKTKQKKTTKK